MIALSKIEEFASILDETTDTRALEKVPFIQRIPVGMYAFSYLEKSSTDIDSEESGMDIAYRVMVYNSTQEAYEQLMESLPALFESFEATDEYLSDELLDKMEEQCRDAFFSGEMVPPYEKKDVISILKYYAQYEAAPSFYTFDDVDRSRLDVAKIARHICDEDMGPRKKAEYIDSIWNSTDDNMLRLFFGRKLYFYQQINIELMKLEFPDIYKDESNVKHGIRKFEDMDLGELRIYNPKLEKYLRDKAFEKAKTKNGEYKCAICGMTSPYKNLFNIDHITALNNKGKTIEKNLQVVCRRCNGIKGDK